MDFCNIYLNKSIREVTEKDLRQFFESPRHENSHLEFKSFHDRIEKKGIFSIFKKSICAFLNSEGGILIFGTPTKNKDEAGKEFYQGELTPFPAEFLPSKDSIISQIVDGIHSMPAGIKFELIKYGQGYVGIFEVPESNTKPHQTDNIYQIRIDGQNKPAPHYLISAMMRELKSAEIELKVTIPYFGSDSIYHYFDYKCQVFNQVDAINDRNVVIDIFISITGHKFTYKQHELKIVSFGFPETISGRIDITNPHFKNDDNTFELAFVFGGELSRRKISYFKCKIWGFEKKYFFNDSIIEKCENLNVSDFIKLFPNQKIISIFK